MLDQGDRNFLCLAKVDSFLKVIVSCGVLLFKLNGVLLEGLSLMELFDSLLITGELTN